MGAPDGRDVMSKKEIILSSQTNLRGICKLPTDTQDFLVTRPFRPIYPMYSLRHEHMTTSSRFNQSQHNLFSSIVHSSSLGQSFLLNV